MFAFHETTRRRICRAGFFALCLAPTAATAAWIGSHHAPGRVGRIARELGRQLDAEVTLVDWSAPRPSSVRSRGLSIREGASGQALVNLVGLEAQDLGESRLLTVEEATIDETRLRRLAAYAQQWLARWPHRRVVLHCGRVVIERSGAAGGQQFELNDVTGRVDRDGAGRVRLQLQAFTRAGGASALKLSMAPAAEQSSAAATITLETGDGGAPAGCLAAFVPGFGQVGAGAKFRGTVQCRTDARGPLVEASGVLEQVDFAAVLPAGSPHRLEGMGTLEISQWRWRGEALERLAGKVRLHQGKISRSLVEAAVSKLYCRPGEAGLPEARGEALLPLDVLALRFELGDDGLLFYGECPVEVASLEGCLAVSTSQPLLVQPPYETYPKPPGGEFRFHLAHWIQAMAAPTAIYLPASKEAIEMSQPLPLPRANAAGSR